MRHYIYNYTVTMDILHTRTVWNREHPDWVYDYAFYQMDIDNHEYEEAHVLEDLYTMVDWDRLPQGRRLWSDAANGYYEPLWNYMLENDSHILGSINVDKTLLYNIIG